MRPALTRDWRAACSERHLEQAVSTQTSQHPSSPSPSSARAKMSSPLVRALTLALALNLVLCACHLANSEQQQKQHLEASGSSPRSIPNSNSNEAHLASGISAKPPQQQQQQKQHLPLLEGQLNGSPQVASAAVDQQPPPKLQKEISQSAANYAKRSGASLPAKLFKKRRQNKNGKDGSGSGGGSKDGKGDVMQLIDKNGPKQPAKRADTIANDDGGAAEHDRQIESLLVRQLSDLVMNNEPETIRRKLTRAQIGNQLTEETRLLTRARLLPAEGLLGHLADEDDELARGEAQPKVLPKQQQPPLVVDEDEGSMEGFSSSSAEDDDDDDQDDDDEDEDAGDQLEEIYENGIELKRLDGELERTTKPQQTAPAAGKRKRRRMTDEPDRVGLAASKPEHNNNNSSSSNGSGFWPWEWLANFRSVSQLQQHQQQDQIQRQSADEAPVDTSESSSSSSGEPSNRSQEELASSSQLEAEQQQQQQLGEQTFVTCDHDMALMEATMDELMLGGAEQRHQLPNGTYLDTLIGGNQTQSSSSGQHMPTLFHQQQCSAPGDRMIEVITKVFVPILFTIIIIVGLVGNIIVFLVILEDGMGLEGLLILDLSISDLLFIIFCIPFTGWDYVVGYWVFGSLWCKLNQYLIIVCANGSIFTLVLMSLDRYLAIVYPIESFKYRTRKNIFMAIIIKWALILTVSLPTLQMHGLEESPIGPDKFSCRFLSMEYDPLIFQMIFFIISYFLPLILIFFLYWRLLKSLWCGERLHGHKESAKKLESKKRVTRTVAWIVIMFAACWGPIHVMLILMRLKWFSITPIYLIIQVIAHTLGYLNSCMNPIIYAYTTESFSQSLRRSRFGGLCLVLIRCGRSSSQNQLNNTNLTNNNNGHNTNGLNNSFGHHHHHQQNQSGGSTTVVVHSSGQGLSGANSARQPPRNSLQIMGSNQLGPTPGGGPTTLGAPGGASPLGHRANKSLGNIFASRPMQNDATTRDSGAVCANSTTILPSPVQSTMRAHDLERAQPEPRQLALEPRDRPQVSKLSPPNSHHQRKQQEHLKQQQQVQQISLSSSASQLSAQPCQADQRRQKATSSSELVPRQPTATDRVFQRLEQKHQQEKQQQQQQQRLDDGPKVEK